METITIRMMLVTVDKSEAPIWTIFEIKIYDYKLEHRTLISSSVYIEA